MLPSAAATERQRLLSNDVSALLTGITNDLLNLPCMSSAICHLAHKLLLPPSSTLSDLFAFMDEDLVKFAQNALQLPGTQVSTERVFSSLKLALNDLRMRLGDDTADAILVLCANRNVEYVYTITIYRAGTR